MRWRRNDETWINASRLLFFPTKRRKKNARRRKAENAHREKWRLWTRVYVDTTTADKTLSPVPRRKYTELRLRPPFNADNSRRGDSGCSSPKNVVARNGRCAYARESSVLSTGIYSERPWILMDPFSPAELSAGTTLICIMQFTCAIYARARIVSRYTWLLVALAERIPHFAPFVFPLFSPSLIYFLLSLRDSRFLSHDTPVYTYNAIVSIASTSRFKLK